MRRLEIHLKEGDAFDIAMRAIKASDPIDLVVLPVEQKNRRLVSVFLRDENGQALMDTLQDCLKNENGWRLSLIPIEATVPQLEDPDAETSQRAQRAIREEIFADVASGAKLDHDYMLLVVFSTIVAAIGLNSNGVAAVIGAMVIAPLLGPILGFCFGIALGDDKLLISSLKTLFVGLSLALFSAVILSLFLDIDLESRELISRAEVRLDGVALAMAAGAAAALSIARGRGSVLVGVMVAAALLPPGAAIGLFLGSGEWALAMRAALLLSLNVAALILSSLIVFRFKGIGPRTWNEQKHASRAIWLNAGISLVVLAIVTALTLILDLGSEISIGG